MWHHSVMSTVTLALPDELEAALSEAMEFDGAHSKEDFLLHLIEEHCAQSKLERILVERDAGPFIPLDPDWQEKVMKKVLDQLQKSDV
jgi:hypothetical protein